MYTLVLVGGTGQRFGLTIGFLHLLGIADRPGSVIVLDAEGSRRDQTNSVTETMDRLFRWGKPEFPIDRIAPYEGRVDSGSVNVSEAVEETGSKLFPLCVNAAEANLGISRGFFANPKIASVVFRAFLARRSSRTRLQAILGSDGSSPPDAPVVIAGSLAGGTGAGIFREVAHAFRNRGAKQILGVAFSHYFQLDQDGLTTPDLILNAKIGFRYLLSKESLSQFDALALVGPPDAARLPMAPAEDIGTPPPFSGFLAAASLVSDGTRGLWADVEEYRRPRKDEKPSPTYVVTFGARTGEHFIRDGDLEFPIESHVSAKSRVSGEALHGAATNAIAAEREFAEFRPTIAAGPWSLFVQDKLGKNLTESLRSLDESHRIQAAHVTRIEEQIDRSTRSAVTDLGSFKRWLETMQSDGSLSLSTDSSRVRSQTWRNCIGRYERGNGASPHERFAQLWSRDVAKGQWEAGSVGDSAAGSAVLFPYLPASLPKPRVGRPGIVERLGPEAIQLEGEVPDRCFPTPLGPALAFRTRLELGRPDAIRQAEALWLGVALGWLDVVRSDLAESPHFFDQLVPQFESRCRYLYLLRIAAGCPIESNLHGKVIGATHPECGLWLGVRPEHLAGCAAIDAALQNEDRERALQVLSAWRRSFKGYPRLSDLEMPVWARVVNRLVADRMETIELDNVRTAGPFLLEVPGRGSKPIYLFQFEAERGPKVDRYLASLGQKRERAAASMAAPALLKAGDGDRVANLLLSGYLEWGSRDAIAGAPSTEDVEAGLNSLRIDPEVVAELALPAAIRGTPSTSSPDLLWARPGARRFAEVPAAPPTGATSLSGIADLEPIPHVYFHWPRREWIVWLSDPTYNAESRLRRSSGDPSVLEVGDGWRLRFPKNSRFLNVKDILVTNPMVLVGQDGQDVLPAIPVKSEFVDLVMCSDNPRPARRDADGITFDFELVGGLRIRPSFPMHHVRREERLHVEVWPNVTGNAWQTFWCGIATDNPEETAGIISQGFVCGAAGHYAPASVGTSADAGAHSHHGPGYWAIGGRPRLIWLGDHAHAAGFIAFGSGTPRPAAASELTVAVDFGTFRTTLVVGPMGGLARAANDVKSFEVSGLVIGAQDEKNAKFWSEQQELLPRLPDVPNSVHITPLSAVVLPSVLAAEGEHSFGDHSYPFRDFGIPTKRLVQMRHFGRLKWRTDEVGKRARRAYLRGILVVGVAEAYARGATDIRVLHTFPLAMDQRLRDGLIKDFADAAEWVERTAFGGQMRVRCQLAASESEAGIYSAQAGGKWIVTLDLGGETLDLGLFSGTTGEHKLLAWDSLHLGGNLVSDALAGRYKWSDEEVRWRLEGDYEIAKPLQTDVERLFLLAVEYAARFVAGMVQAERHGTLEGQIDVVLLGSGWRWHRVLTEGPPSAFEEDSFQRQFIDVLRSRIKALASNCQAEVSLNAAVLHAGREKFAVAIGLARLPLNLPGGQVYVQAPNGLDEEGGLGWATLIKQDASFPPPEAVLSTPAFPETVANKLDSSDPSKRLPASATKSIQGTVKSHIAETTSLQGIRRRTALGVVYDTLAPHWFPRN